MVLGKKYVIKKTIRSNVSNGTGFSCPAGQRDRCTFLVPGQRDNGTSSKSCHRTGRARTACQNPGRDAGRDNHYFSVKIRDGTGTGRDNRYFFPMISYFTTSFPVLERTFPVLEHPMY